MVQDLPGDDSKFPLLLILFGTADNLDKYLAKKLPPNIALSYVYWLTRYS